MQGVLLPNGHSEQMGECPDCDGKGFIETKPDELSLTKTRDATVSKKRAGYDHARNLGYILDGEEVFGAKTWDYLKPVSAKGAGSFDTHEVNFPNAPEVACSWEDGGQQEVRNPTIPRVFPYKTTIVGSSYRDSVQQMALRKKNVGNRVLLVPEPGNPHDCYALAVVVAKGTSQNSFVWTHVGYVPREQAKELAKVWPRYRGKLLVGEGRLLGDPNNERNPSIMIEPSFRNYFEK